jgi:hypothetical protein
MKIIEKGVVEILVFNVYSTYTWTSKIKMMRDERKE